jgi:hypothetical protein
MEPGFQRLLYKHQEAAVRGMELIESGVVKGKTKSDEALFSRLGIYADRRGTGRRLSILALVARDRRPWDTSEPYVLEIVQDLWGDGQLIRRTTRRLRRVGTTLIVCHRSRLRAWATEASTTPLSVRVLYTKRDLADLPVGCDVAVCHTALLQHLAEATRGMAWKRVVLDGRAHKTRVITGFTWCMWPEPFPGLGADVSRRITVRTPGEDVRLSICLSPVRHARHACRSMFEPGGLRRLLSQEKDTGWVVDRIGGTLVPEVPPPADGCLVCLGDAVDPVVLGCCGRGYCGACILEWFCTRWTCPACRAGVSPSMLLAAGESGQEPTREEVVRALALERRLVVVAAFPRKIEGCVLWTENLRSSVLSTHDLVVYHPLPVATIARITDRFQCIGRRTPLTVHYLDDSTA